MSKLDFLEISRNFKSYYRTLRDVHYYLTNDPELSDEELQAVSKVISKLIYGFIRIKGTSFREMDRELFEEGFNLFHQDFLNVIQYSGENNVDFNQFTSLLDEIIGIAVKRTIALGKIKKVKQESLLEDNEIAEDTYAESLESDEEVEEDVKEDVKEDDAIVADDDVVEEVIEVINEIQEEVPEVETLSTEVHNLSTEDKIFSTAIKNFSTDVKTFSIGVKNFSTDVEDVLNEARKAEDKKPEPVNKEVVADVVNKVKMAPEPPKKVKNNFIDAAPVGNNFNDYESSDNFRFRPRRRRNR
jgi:hypothetical protein